MTHKIKIIQSTGFGLWNVWIETSPVVLEKTQLLLCTNLKIH